MVLKLATTLTAAYTSTWTLQAAQFDQPVAELWYPSATRDAFPDSPPLVPYAWRRLLCSHTSAVNACATHPLKPHVYASAGASGEAHIWHAGTGAPLGRTPIVTARGPVTALQFDPSGAHLALGLGSGTVEVYSQGRRRLHSVPACAGRVTDLKYARAPALAGERGRRDVATGVVLAAGSSDGSVALLAAEQGYRVYVRCRGHAAAVAHLDFSVDGSTLRSMCSACEVLEICRSAFVTCAKVGFITSIPLMLMAG